MSRPQRKRASPWTEILRQGGPTALLMIAMTSAIANAHSYKLGEIAVGHIWAPPTAEGSAGTAVYGAILNQGERPVRLVGASTQAADKVRFRVEQDGRVRWPESIELLPGNPLSLAPWRQHIWLAGLRRPLKGGDAFDLMLDFGDAGSLTVEVVVEEAAGH